MATFMMDLLTTNKASGKVPAILDKVQSFTKPDILLKKGTKKKKVVVSYYSVAQLILYYAPTVAGLLLIELRNCSLDFVTTFC